MVRHNHFHQFVEISPLCIVKLPADQVFNLFIAVKRSQALNRQNLAEALFEGFNLQVYSLMEDVVQAQVDVVLQVVKCHFLLVTVFDKFNRLVRRTYEVQVEVFHSRASLP
jgi:hypothetical protein